MAIPVQFTFCTDFVSRRGQMVEVVPDTPYYFDADVTRLKLLHIYLRWNRYFLRHFMFGNMHGSLMTTWCPVKLKYNNGEPHLMARELRLARTSEMS